MEHQRLVDFINKEAVKRNVTVSELARSIGFNESHLGNIMRGQQPGLDVCIRLARSLHVKADYLLYLAGHFEIGDMSTGDIPIELAEAVSKAAQLRGTPYYDLAVSGVENTLSLIIEAYELAQ